MVEIKSRTKNKILQIFTKIFLWVLFVIFLLYEMSIIAKILNQMFTSGEPLPLQAFLYNFDTVRDFINTIFIAKNVLHGKIWHVLWKQSLSGLVQFWQGIPFLFVIRCCGNIIYNYTSKPIKTVIFVQALVIFWELF